MFSRSCCQQIAQFFSTGAVSASFQFFDKFDIVVMNRPIRISICPRNKRKKRRQRERARERAREWEWERDSFGWEHLSETLAPRRGKMNGLQVEGANRCKSLVPARSRAWVRILSRKRLTKRRQKVEIENSKIQLCRKKYLMMKRSRRNEKGLMKKWES